MQHQKKELFISREKGLISYVQKSAHTSLSQSDSQCFVAA